MDAPGCGTHPILRSFPAPVEAGEPSDRMLAHRVTSTVVARGYRSAARAGRQKPTVTDRGLLRVLVSEGRHATYAHGFCREGRRREGLSPVRPTTPRARTASAVVLPVATRPIHLRSVL